MGIYSGRMNASSGYDSVRHVFKVFCRALDLMGDEQEAELDRYYRMRDDLELTVVSQDGQRVTASWIHVVDLCESLDELKIELSSMDPRDA